MSAQQVTEADLATKIDCTEADIKAWLESKQSPRAERQYDQVLWEIQHEQPPWWAPIATPAAAPAAAPAEAATAQAAEVSAGDQQLAGGVIELDYDSAGLTDEDLLDGEVTYYTGNSEDILRDKDLEQLYVTVNTVVDHLLCANGHPMITMGYAGPGYVTGYVCDVCTGCSSERETRVDT